MSPLFTTHNECIIYRLVGNGNKSSCTVYSTIHQKIKDNFHLKLREATATSCCDQDIHLIITITNAMLTNAHLQFGELLVYLKLFQV